MTVRSCTGGLYASTVPAHIAQLYAIYTVQPYIISSDELINHPRKIRKNKNIVKMLHVPNMVC